MITVYRLEQDGFDKPLVRELAGETPVGVLPGVTIQWEEVLRRLPAQEY